MSTESKLPPWGSAVAGATGAVLANALVYPLDIVKTRLQVQVTTKPSSSSSSVALSPRGATDKDGTEDGDDDDTEKTLSETGEGGHHEKSQAKKVQHYDSSWDAITKIVDEEGLSGLYAGIAGSLVGVASTNFAYFYWYTVVRRLYLRMSSSSAAAAAAAKPGMAVELSLGAVSGALAQLFTIPVAVITTRQQTQLKGERRSFIDTAREVVEGEDGITGLWRGLKASLVLVINPSITYGAYQKLRDGLFPGKLNLRPAEAFFLGSLSKMIATIATQPLIVAKVGLQSRPPPERKGKPFGGFVEVMRYIIEHEGASSLFKGIGPQILKGLLVQGLLMMTKERIEILFVVLFSYLKRVRAERMGKRAVVLV